MKILIFGATGTAGSEVVRQAISDPEITLVSVVVRKPFDFNYPKMQTIIHHDFLDYKEMLPAFREADACIWCLGISQTKVGKEQYFIITHDYAVAAAKAMLSVNPQISFVFLSGQGADSSEKSKVLFARVKGQTENALKSLPFKHYFIFRPAGIVPVTKQKNLAFMKKAEFSLLKFMAMILPIFTISTVQLAKAMLILIKKGDKFKLLENENIKQIANCE
ncbi:MAG: NAD(P)H-binding protein [Bacteroidia bacterium]|nr:NAD(P)H-binding protein [Bacteroidia bacterium]